MFKVLIIDEGNNYNELIRYMGSIKYRVVTQNHPFLSYTDIISDEYDVFIIDEVCFEEQKLKLISKLCEINSTATMIIVNDSDNNYYINDKLKDYISSYIIKKSPMLCEQIATIIKNLYQCKRQNRKELIKNRQEVYKLIQYIEKNYHKKISLNTLSQVSHFNPYYISSMFKKTTGMNLKDYIRDIRINKAKELLIDTNYNISVVGTLVGYGEPVSFNRAFKRVVGSSPTQYREKVDIVI